MQPNVLKRLVNQMSEQVAKQYAQAQKAEMAEIHNRFVQIIDEIKPATENLLLVLELLKQEALGNLISKFEQIKATTPPSPSPEVAVKPLEIAPEEKPE